MKSRNTTRRAGFLNAQRGFILQHGTSLLSSMVAPAIVFAFVAVLSEDAGEAPVSQFLKSAPPQYRDWKLISVAHEEGNLNDIRAILGNEIAIQAYREGKQEFPDGAIIARLAWEYLPSEENNAAFGRRQSFVAGQPTNGVQFMVKDSKRYAATGGWGFGHFVDGQPASDGLMQGCFPCHEAARVRDRVFSRYSP